jgi:hypothetical protein
MQAWSFENGFDTARLADVLGAFGITVVDLTQEDES